MRSASRSPITWEVRLTPIRYGMSVVPCIRVLIPLFRLSLISASAIVNTTPGGPRRIRMFWYHQNDTAYSDRSTVYLIPPLISPSSGQVMPPRPGYTVTTGCVSSVMLFVSRNNSVCRFLVELSSIFPMVFNVPTWFSHGTGGPCSLHEKKHRRSFPGRSPKNLSIHPATGVCISIDASRVPGGCPI
jgi:hypothetical protein